MSDLREHSRIPRWFAEEMARDPRFKGRVLDVGCGSEPSIKAYQPVYRLAAQLDGLDPSPEVWQHQWLSRRWQGEFEKCAVPENEYDALISINVAEHVGDPAGFLRQAFKVLKPGGRYYSLTPSGVHPFPYCVRIIQALGLKKGMVEGQQGWNDYPAYYRLNTPGAVSRHASAAGFKSLTLLRHPNTQWHQYWPRFMRALPWAFDAVIGCRVTAFYQQFMWVLEKPGTWGGPSTRLSEPELSTWRAANVPPRDAATKLGPVPAV